MNSPTTNNAEVLAYIKNHCKQLLGSKFWQIRFLCKVDIGAGKMETKYMVMSKFRLFFLAGKSTSKLQVESSYNVLSVKEIALCQEHELLLCLDGKRLHVQLHDSGFTAMDVAKYLLQAFKNYFPSCDPMRFIQVNPPSLYTVFLLLPRSRPSLSCDGFRRTYASLCDYYKLPFRDEVVWDIEKIYTLHNASVLRLDDFSHLLSKDLVPVIASLQFMSWFNGINSDGFKLSGEVVDIIVTVVKKSQHLKSLVLRNSGLKSEFLVSLAAALNANQSIPLELIDFSGNTFDDGKAVSQFASALASLTIGCRSINMADCGMGVKSINAVCAAMQQNQKRAGSKTLSTISFAKNALKSDIPELSHLLSSTALETLDVSGTGVSLESVLTALKSGSDRISTLILSGCSFPERKGKDLATSNSVKDFFANASSLRFIDLSDCALPSEMLKFMLLGLVCNQKIKSLRLDLTRSFADRQCFSVLETCAQNLMSVTELILRDVNMEQDALTLIRALASMPSLRRLDLGGNNFNTLRKQQPKILLNVMLEVVKLINDEEGSIRELILSDCHLGVNLSVLLNALGVAPILISLDISGNDFGNTGARLLAKALQLNTVLETLSIDKNQITYEGYVDILHSLKGNSTLRSIPYPIHDACEALKFNRDKTESTLVEIEQLLHRNIGKPSIGDGMPNTEAHCRLLLTNVDDEINKAVYSAENSLTECKYKDSHPDVAQLKTLLDDAEASKKLLDEMKPVFNRGDFIDDFVDAFAKQYLATFDEKMKLCNSELCDVPGRSISACKDEEFSAALRETSTLKTRSFSAAIDPMFAGFRETLRQHFRRATFAVACGTVEKVDQEILRSMAMTSKNLDEGQFSSTIQSSGSGSGSMLSTSMQSSGGTPKGKRKKFRLFARSTRPKSIIESDGILDNTDDTLEEAAMVGTPIDSCGDSLDSESFEVVDKPALASDDGAEEGPKLTHVVKDRPRLPYQRRNRAAAPVDKRPSKDELDYSAGVDNFFSASSADSERPPAPLPTANEENNIKFRPVVRALSPPKDYGRDEHQSAVAPVEAPKRMSRIPPNAVPLINAEVLGKIQLASRPPPPSYASSASSNASKGRDESQHSALSHTTSPIEIDTSTEYSSKQMSTSSEVSSLSVNEKLPFVTSVSPAIATKVIPPSPVGNRKDTENSPRVEMHHRPPPTFEGPPPPPKESGRSPSPLKVSPSLPIVHPPPLSSREATPRSQDDNNGNTSNRSIESVASRSEENNNSSFETTSPSSSIAVAPRNAAFSPPPRPPPPASKMVRDARDARLRQPEAPPAPAEAPEGAILRNKTVDATAAAAQAANQRKSVMDLKGMFEQPARPVPPPRPNKSKVAPAAN